MARYELQGFTIGDLGIWIVCTAVIFSPTIFSPGWFAPAIGPAIIDLVGVAFWSTLAAAVVFGPPLMSVAPSPRAPWEDGAQLRWEPRASRGHLLRLAALMVASLAIAPLVWSQHRIERVWRSATAECGATTHRRVAEREGSTWYFCGTPDGERVYRVDDPNPHVIAWIRARNRWLIGGLAAVAVGAGALALARAHRRRVGEVRIDGQGLVLQRRHGQQRAAWSTVRDVAIVRRPWLAEKELRIELVDGRTWTIPADGSPIAHLGLVRRAIDDARARQPAETVPDDPDLAAVRRLAVQRHLEQP